MQSILPVELPEYSKNTKEMVIESEFGNDLLKNIGICHYPNLEKIVVKKYALIKLNSMEICHNERLKSIDIESSDEGEGNGSFINLNKMVLEGMIVNQNSIQIFLICNPVL